MIRVKLFFLVALFIAAVVIFWAKSQSLRIRRSAEKEFLSPKKDEELPPFTFDDLYNSNFSYSTFYPNWVSDTEYLFRNESGIQKINLATNENKMLVPDDFYVTTGANGWSISNDEKYFLARTSYTKQWRYSYNASYVVYDIITRQVVWNSGSPDVQYITWSPVNHGLLWVVGNNLYYKANVSDSTPEIALEDNGSRNKIFNGIPDWVYEEEMVSSTNNIFWSPDGRFIAYLVTDDTDVEMIEFSRYGNLQYPEMIEVAYPKAGTTNPTVTLKVYDSSVTENFTTIEAPSDIVGSDHLFCSFYWYSDSNAFQVHWLNRISNVAAIQLCQHGTEWTCSILESSVERIENGWIGNGGTTFRPIMKNDSTRSFFTIFANENGYWQISHVDTENNEARFLTDGTSVVTSLQAYDEDNGWLYFSAAHPLPRQRHLFRIPTSASETPIAADDWECISCENFDPDRCQWITPSFSPQMTYLVINCGGPDVPMSTLQSKGAEGNYSSFEVVENNDELFKNKEGVKWPVKEYGVIDSENGIEILYQMHKPMDFDESNQYPLLIEVYGGPGFQKVQDRWTRGWAPIHMVSQYNVIVVSLDGRGSGYRGNNIAHMLYKKIGQLEKIDTTEVGRYFASQPYIDETRIAVWGWSYGGYTTTFTISEGSGVFKCGLAVAPLASRLFYDSIHTERYMDLPSNNVDGYEKCSILNSNLENFKKASYSIIHGTADDNVHFQNAALISKALISAEVDFDNFFYADEAHSVNTGDNANRHIYQLLTKKIKHCFNLENPDGRRKRKGSLLTSIMQKRMFKKKK